MSPLFVPSLVPIVLLPTLLAGSALRLGQRGLAAWCLATAAWALSLLLVVRPETRALGERLLMVGFFVPAAFRHAIGEELGWPRRPLLLYYGSAGLITALGLLRPHLFLGDGGTTAGPAFPFMFAMAALLSWAPVLGLAAALRRAPEGGAERLRYLSLAGLMGTGGGGVNVLSMLRDRPSPAGLYIALASVLLMALVVQGARLPSFGRFVERSLRYSLLAALLSAAWVGLVWVILQLGTGLSYSWGAGFLLFLGVLAGQPVVAWARGRLAGALFPGHGDLPGMAEALAHSEARAEHNSRLAELGTLASAVAHEVRNPLGVIAAATTVLSRQGADPGAIEEIRAQVDRAARFADELLEYGRPAPLTLRAVDLAAAAALAADEVRRALPMDAPPHVEVLGEVGTVKADLGQIVRLFGVLVENAAQAAPGGRVRVSARAEGEVVIVAVEDSGPGVPEALEGRLFQPFVSGRGRQGPRPGTGLGLAIARGVAERHHGALVYAGRSGDLGGACFELRLPREPPLPVGG